MNNILQDNQILIFTFLSVIVFILATYLGFLLNKIRIQKKIDELRLKEIEQLRLQREQSILESVRILAKAVLTQQCEVSEGCIRIKNLLDAISFEMSDSLKPINDLYDEIKHFDYLDARNKLSKQERFNQDKERFKIEDRHAPNFKNACKAILEQIDQ